MREITFSEMSSFKRCQKRHNFEYVERIRPKKKHPEMWAGSGFHVGMAAHYNDEDGIAIAQGWANSEIARLRSENPDLWDEDIEMLEKNRELIISMVTVTIEALANRGADEGIEVISVEREFDVPVRTPAGNMARCRYVGKVDGLVRWQDGLWLMEHKTAAQVGDAYITQLQLDEQVSCYMWALGCELGEPLMGCIYNIARKQLPGPRVKAPLFYREFVWRNPSEMQEIQSRIYNTYRAIATNKTVIPNPSQMTCRGCPYWTLCLEDTPEARTYFESKERAHEELGGANGV